LDHIFRIYIKSIGKDTACRAEESLNPEKPAVQAINEIFSTQRRREHQKPCIDDNSSTRSKITEIHDMVKSLLELHKRDSGIAEEKLLLLEKGGS
jgi:hypothetical protein